MADENEDNKEYRWETGYEKTWEALEEDEDGLLESSIADIIEKSKRKRHADKIGVRLGMMRHMNVIVDCSEAMQDQDLKPTRHMCTLKLFEGFIEEFFEQNPISQLGIIVTRNKRAERLTDLSGNYRRHLEALQTQCSDPNYCIGEPSLQNSLELAYSTMRMLPTHTSREVLVIMGSLTVCDPGDINVIIQQLASAGIRCSVIGLAAEVCVYKLLARLTRGSYSVVLDDRHFRDLLSAQSFRRRQ
uniref:General transcription factor IIH subunit 2 n=1 Tax=Cacopsylla melanoneura TaxID=428564 RepID=A0A8D8PMX8_9HEMI